uniref:ATP synthase complex subunit 8 n=2 Tax=Pionites leucogaster TaxID=345186 RepID=A0A0M3LTV1_9PSIT|nr:ATP synthase F0 subunit 8 [Pionites leucogaster]AJG35736.1 ATP synthase F0 subunit 8 [Pionites leucogaster]QDP17074.1 ATP synthase F0 subunit 8 [Pionites leucogaster]
MPQLNPNPWLFVMISTWLTFSLILQPKTLSFISTNPPINKTPTTTKNLPWTWPWS